MESNAKPSLLTNINYLKKIIDQDPESLASLLSQKELSTIFLMSTENQNEILNQEMEIRTYNPEIDFHQFFLNRKKIWIDLIQSDSQKAFAIIKPIIEFEVDNRYSLENFILLETIH